MKELVCECGKFKAELQHFPKNTPGRCICYCADCQSFMRYLNRSEFLDAHGGSEIIPVYPSDMKIVQGAEHVACLRLSPKGLFRFYTSCCKTPIGNAVAKFPYIGLIAPIFGTSIRPHLDRTVGPIKSRIQGQSAIGTPPPGTSSKTSFKDILVVLPFIAKGFLTGKAKPSPLFEADAVSPISTPYVLSQEERAQHRRG